MSRMAEFSGRPVIIGAGLAGLSTALSLAPKPVVVLSKFPLGQDAASTWAQGGLAAAMLDGDSPQIHAQDTIGAGNGLNDPAIVAHFTGAGPDAVAWLDRLGVRFSRDAEGKFVCKLEAAHTRRRVLNAGGDSSGAEIMRAVVAAVRNTPSITVIEGVAARALLTDGNGAIAGVEVQGPNGAFTIETAQIVMASGGAGGLWRDTTNPLGSIGEGLAMAAMAGAALTDLEFVQFHPTAIDAGLDPMPLASEALRGDGATLINDAGERFMARYDRAELEPRDIVTRAVWGQISAGQRVYLDTRAAIGLAFPKRFPSINAKCLTAGIDPTKQPIPIRPAAHYHMGGIAVDPRGRTTLTGLWACGEAATTGLHGANRLASNSLLEAIVAGRDVAADIAGTSAPRIGDSRPVTHLASSTFDQDHLSQIRTIMTDHVGVLRDRRGLAKALRSLLVLATIDGPSRLPATSALLISASAILRRESRGGHFRTDFPAADPSQARRHLMTLDQAFTLAQAQTLETL